MRIDCHMHVNFKGVSAKSLISYLDNNNIDYCWLLTWEEKSTKNYVYQHLSIEDVFNTYNQYPDRIIPMYSPDPDRKEAADALIHWHKRGIRGCAELKSNHNWNSNKIRDLLSTVSKLKIPVLFHMEQEKEIVYPLSSDSKFASLSARAINTKRFFGTAARLYDFISSGYKPLKRWKEERTFLIPGYMLDIFSFEMILKDFPQINFIGHGPLFWKHISDNKTDSEHLVFPNGPVIKEGLTCKLLEKYPNLYADISAFSGYNALHRDPEFARKFLLKFSNKILYGTDNASLEQEEFINSLSLDANSKKKIFGENAYSLL